MSETAKLIFTRQHPLLADKAGVWRLIDQAYKGGISFINSDNLYRYMIEDSVRYDQRLKRADYQNHTAMLIDMLAGFLYAKPVKRDIDKEYSYIIERIYRGKSMQNLMSLLSVATLKYTCGILVDSPDIDTTGMSKADRTAGRIDPYVIFYPPFRICDYEMDESGELEWITLDNTSIDKSDPLTAPAERKVKRLWTKEYYHDVEEKVVDGEKVYNFVTPEPIYHNLGRIPFTFVNARDCDIDGINDSIFEDIAIKSRKIFNISSWLDESLMASAFKILFMPYETKEDTEAIIALFAPNTAGIADVPAVPFRTGSQRPFFDGPAISDKIDNYLKAINQANEEILNKFGLRAESRGSWESGVAKSIDFSKTEAILRATSLQLQATEQKIVEFCGLWEDREIKATIEYPTGYEKDDLDKEVTRLIQVISIGSDTLKRKAARHIAIINFPDSTPEELKAIEDEVVANRTAAEDLLSGKP